MRPWRSGADVLSERLAAHPSAARERALAAAVPASPPPEYVAAKLAQLRLLHDVPFAHLVPDAALLEPESLRFFALDSEWTDALIDGAQSVGVTSAAELAHHEATRAVGRAAAELRAAHGPRPHARPRGRRARRRRRPGPSPACSCARWRSRSSPASRCAPTAA